MTLPTSGPLSLSDVLLELKTVNPSRSAPISLGDADVLALAGKSAPPISLSDLYGKSSYVPMTVVATGDSDFRNSTVAGTAACSPSVTISGGKGAKTITWVVLSNPGGATVSNLNATSCLVSKGYTKFANGSATVQLRCDVQDETGALVSSNTVTAELTWEYNP